MGIWSAALAAGVVTIVIASVFVTGAIQGRTAQADPCATIIQGAVVNPANGHTYVKLDKMTWTTSEAAAVCLGGHLAAINDAAEQAFVYATFGTVGRFLWIGLNDAAMSGTWVWTTGELASYTNWGLGEPNNIGTEHFGYIYPPDAPGPYPGTWDNYHDVDNDGGFDAAGVVEIVDGDVDSDVDGCTDLEEVGPNPALGGVRNPLDPLDFPDLDDDLVITILDLSAEAALFLQPPSPPVLDLDGDGTITILDLAEMADQFLDSCAAPP